MAATHGGLAILRGCLRFEDLDNEPRLWTNQVFSLVVIYIVLSRVLHCSLLVKVSNKKGIDTKSQGRWSGGLYKGSIKKKEIKKKKRMTSARFELATFSVLTKRYDQLIQPAIDGGIFPQLDIWAAGIDSRQNPNWNAPRSRPKFILTLYRGLCTDNQANGGIIPYPTYGWLS